MEQLSSCCCVISNALSPSELIKFSSAHALGKTNIVLYPPLHGIVAIKCTLRSTFTRAAKNKVHYIVTQNMMIRLVTPRSIQNCGEGLREKTTQT